MADRTTNAADSALQRNPWFRALSLALQRAVRQAAETRHVGAGEWIYGTGDAPRGVFAMLDGAALVYVALPRGDDVLVHVAGVGEVFGHAARLGRGPRLATVLAARDAIVLYLSESALEQVGRAHPELWGALTELLYQQYGALLVQLAGHLALPARSRLAGRLLQLSGPTDLAHIGQAQLAELVGVTRKTVNVLLGEMARAGVLQLGHGKVAVLHRSALQDLARGVAE